MSNKSYEKIVTSIRQITKSDVDGRMRMGQLVNDALQIEGIGLHTIAVDTGITIYTLTSYLNAWSFWGDVRVEGGTWSNYRSATNLASQFPKVKVRDRIVKKGWDELRVLFNELQPIEQEQNYMPTLATAKFELNQAASVLNRCVSENVTLTASERKTMQKQLAQILAAASKLGIQTGLSLSREKMAA